MLLAPPLQQVLCGGAAAGSEQGRAARWEVQGGQMQSVARLGVAWAHCQVQQLEVVPSSGAGAVHANESCNSVLTANLPGRLQSHGGCRLSQ